MGENSQGKLTNGWYVGGERPGIGGKRTGRLSGMHARSQRILTRLQDLPLG